MADTAPAPSADFAADTAAFGRYWAAQRAALARLSRKPARSPAESADAAAIHAGARAARRAFLGAHAGTLYEELTDGRRQFRRLEELVPAAAALCPGLVPDAGELAAEAGLLQGAKEGWEIDQGLLVAAWLAEDRAGPHLCHAMLLPRAETPALLARLAAEGSVDLGAAHVARQGRASVVELRNPAALNAEDDTTLDAAEIAVDLATLDPATEICVLRGGAVTHPRHAGRRILGAGINLTHLHAGRIPYLWFPRRELGLVHKLYRGVATPDALPDDVQATAREKLWIAALETFAIGGHCQMLLAVDYVLAEADAYMTLPARKEGIIPGLANLRLPRFVGDRIARQAIQYERRLDCDSAAGRMICDEVVPPGTMDAALAQAVEGLTGAGPVSAVGNRRGLRLAQEPLELFRRYVALYAREQAECHFSPALIANLERHWLARPRG
ncbi:MAG TPA: enoyl-CoA hydratase/isomerase family protein [Crenalkalicoccus sp.]|nr:enoyl-CoA hydratase/isomerase family protein [Crenalkalicoccus sp.]